MPEPGADPSGQTLTPGDAPPPPLAPSQLRARQRTCMPWAICGSMYVADTYGSGYWHRPCIWQRAAPRSSSWPRPSPRRARRTPHSWTTHGT